MRLITAMLARNEASSWLSRVLERCWEFSDEVVLLDDNSEDDTGTVAAAMGCEVFPVPSDDVAWGNETPRRALLWNLAAHKAQNGWILFCDADMLLRGDPRPYTHSLSVNAWSFVLYDLWDSEDHYRADSHWKGHVTPRPWLFRPSAVSEGWTPQWGTAGIHSGHAPPNFPYVGGVATDLSWDHQPTANETANTITPATQSGMYQYPLRDQWLSKRNPRAPTVALPRPFGWPWPD